MSPADVHELLAARYAGERCIRMLPLGGGDAAPDGYINVTDCNDTNRVDLLVSGNAEQILVAARLDNLGKGAAGAAVQNLNLMLGLPEYQGV